MIDIFTSFYEKSIFFIVIALWLLSELLGGRIIPYFRRKGTKININDRGSGFLFGIGMLISLGIGYYFAKNDIALLPGWTFYLGIIFVFLGIIVRQWSIAVLGRFFSPMVGIQKGQKVIDYGPYRLVRHPSYTGYLMILLGIGFMLQSWGAVLVILMTWSIVLGYRIKIEEKVLISNFGYEYISYMEKTKRLIPYII
jgi:protein-S-isoprenylcysteine O-methyltransferase Ste14